MSGNVVLLGGNQATEESMARRAPRPFEVRG